MRAQIEFQTSTSQGRRALKNPLARRKELLFTS
jgi:hypothetical protein